MKKILSVLIILTMLVSALVGCNNTKVPVEKDYSLSIGVVVTEKPETLKVTETVAAIVTDADGKIVLCRLDCMDYTAKYNEDGTLDTTAPISKVATGSAYGTMPAGSWDEQSAALEKFVLGKTQAEVAATALDGTTAADADLKASCSINIVDLLKAIDNAFKSEKKMSFKASSEALTAGLNIIGTAKDSSVELTAQTEKNLKFSTTFSAAVMADGKVVAAILDSADVEFKNITDAGASTYSFAGTKRELGENYGMMPSGTWYTQADAYAAAAIGKTADDIATLASEGVAGCTIYAGEYKQGIEAAVKAAR